jgi:hypothetical protein
MTLTAEQRRQINRQNASHSTGPRSTRGKQASRLNALKHGLRIETLALPTEDADTLQGLADQWHNYYQPDSPAECELINRAVLAAIQMRRCARFQTAALARQIRNAVDQWDHTREEEVERLKALLPEDPDAAVRGLQRTSEGCLWLLQRWEKLEAKRAKDGLWCGADRDEVIRLCGFRPERLKECPEAFLIRLYNLLAQPHPNEKALEWLFRPERLPDAIGAMYNLEFLPERASCMESLREMVAEERERLRAREERLRVKIDEPDRAEAAERALLLEGPEAALLLRYERAHESAFHRAYGALLKGRKESARGEDSAPPQQPSALNDQPSGCQESTHDEDSTSTVDASAPNERSWRVAAPEPMRLAGAPRSVCGPEVYLCVPRLTFASYFHGKPI